MQLRFIFCLVVLLFCPVAGFSASIDFAPGLRGFGVGGAVQQDVASADFNVDGTPDLVVVRPDSISILLGKGDGTFADAVKYGVGQNSIAVAIDDFNGDAIPDLAVTSANDGSISLLFGNGDGTFGAVQTYVVGEAAFDIASGDFDADDKPDLVVTDLASQSILILRNDGAGGFLPALSYGVGSATGDVAIGDFNGDGHLDVVAVGSEMSIFIGNGDGTLQPATSFTTGYKSSVITADFDADGKLDLVTTNMNDNSVSLLYGNGDGTFRTAVDFPVGERPFASVSGDFNNDGKLDLAVANGFGDSVTILLGTGTGSFLTATELVVGSQPCSVVLGDFNGDARIDLAVALNGVYSSTISVLNGGGNGTFQTASIYPANDFPESIVVGDINADSQPDLILNGSTLLGNGDGTFQSAVPFTWGNSAAAGDIDADGKLDLAVTHYGSDSVAILRGAGNGTFVEVASYAVGTSPDFCAFGDFDGDGRLDLAVNSRKSNSISILLGNGDGTFAPAGNYDVGSASAMIVVDDFNRDGKPDLAVTNTDSNSISILAGNGDGTFAAVVKFPTVITPISLASGDFNTDGHADLVVASGYNNVVSISLGNGDGTFAAAVDYPVGSFHNAVAIGELDGDGKLDLAVTNTGDGSVSILRGNGNGTFQLESAFGAGIRPLSVSFVAIADFNGDGKPDLAATDMMFDSVSILLNSTDHSAWLPGNPRVAMTSSTTVGVTVGADRAGAAYAVCLPAGAAYPSVQQVRAGQNAAGEPLAVNLTAYAIQEANLTAILTFGALTPDTPYDIYVVAADGDGSLQPWPTKLSVATSAQLSSVIAPTVLNPAGNVSTQTPALSWNAAANATGYDLYTSRGGVATTTSYTAEELGCATGMVCSVVSPTLPNGTSVYWVVRAKNAAAKSDWSVAKTFMVSLLPAVPTLIAPSGSVASTTPTLSWNAAANASGYDLYTNSVGVATTKSYTAEELGCAIGSVCSVVCPALANGTAVYWVVRAKNAVATSDWSSAMTLNVSLLPAVPALASPSGMVASLTPTYTWNAAVNAVSYELYRNIGGVGTTTSVTAAEAGCATGTVCSVVSPVLPNGTAVYWVVRAKNAVAASAWSSSMTLNVKVLPTVPTLVGPAGTVASPTPGYTWNAAANATSYDLYTHIGGVATTVTYTAAELGCETGGVCSAISPALANGTSVYWVVRAKNAVAKSDWSSAKTFTVQF